MPQGKFKKLLTKRARKGDKGYPIATLAFYGPTDKLATKLVCGVIQYDGADAEPIKKWFAKDDIRQSEHILKEALSFIEQHQVLSVVMVDQILGCPHEEVIDYPEGESCPMCPYWAGRDRYSGEVVH